MENKEAMLRKVRGLLAKAEDPACTPEEAEAFSRKAEALIAKYAIDLALLQEKTGRGKPTMIRVQTEASYRKPFIQLLFAVTEGFGCKMIVVGQKNEVVEIVGFEGDLDMVQTLYASLLLQATNGMLHEVRRLGLTDMDIWRFKQSYVLGFAGRVHERLQELRDTGDDEPGTALVLRDRGLEVVDDFKARYPRTTRLSGARSHDSGAYQSGAAAANRADLGGRKVSGGRRQIA